MYNYLKEKHNLKKKNIVTFIDQNFSYHPDFYIKRRKPIISSKNYYKNILKYFNFIEKEYKTKVVIAGHPKKGLKNNPLYQKKYKVYYNKTENLISQSRFVIMHYSTAVSYCVLFNKPIIFITNNELKYKRAGYQIKTLTDSLGSNIINIDNAFKKIKPNVNFFKYKKYKNNYLKYPGSEEQNSWDIINEYLKKRIHNL